MPNPKPAEVRAIRRVALKLSQRAFGELLGVHRCTVEGWEYGYWQCPPATWALILKKLPPAPRHPEPDDVRRARRLARQSQPSAASSLDVSLICWQSWESGERRMPKIKWALYLAKHGLPSDFSVSTDILKAPKGVFSR